MCLPHLHAFGCLDQHSLIRSSTHSSCTFMRPTPKPFCTPARLLPQVLKNYGHKGRSVSKIVEEMSKKGLREFSNARNAKSSVASTCAHDTAFARVAPGTFALRAVPGVVEVTHLHYPLRTARTTASAVLFLERLQKSHVFCIFMFSFTYRMYFV